MQSEIQDLKKKQLKNHKRLATFFFVLMVVIYFLMVYLLKHAPGAWMGFVKAFAEAAMVGALADWFAVTALFHHPMGLKIPHTNLIERKKKDIGNNLGSFVVENFLNPSTLKPYINKIEVAGTAATWLESEKNRRLILSETAQMLLQLLEKTSDQDASRFIKEKGADLLSSFRIGPLLGNALDYLVDHGQHSELLDFLLDKIKVFVAENEDMVRKRVKKESGILVPGFVDNMLANRITVGLANYLHEIQQDPNHSIRQEITGQLYKLAGQLKEGTAWREDLEKLKAGLLHEDQLQKYAGNVWQFLKSTLQKELVFSGEESHQETTLFRYLDKQILAFSNRLKSEAGLRLKIDSWVRFTAYRLALRNVDNAGKLISQTVGNWEGKELSEKLELEVGKDLQFIRINGTVVGGLVGLLIYTLTLLL